jgi:hypothetical protein
MAPKTEPGDDHEPITIRAAKINAKINGKYVVLAAVITAFVGAAAGLGSALLGANGHGGAQLELITASA